MISEIDPNSAAVAFNYLFANCQSQAGSRKFLPAVQALEYDKYPIGIFRINSYPVVTYGEKPVTTFQPGRYMNLWDTIIAKFARVVDKILKVQALDTRTRFSYVFS